MEILIGAILIGVGATVLVDLWMIVRWRLLRIPLTSYGLVGRWIALMAHGQFRHFSIAAAPSVPRERLIGWIVHYLTGILFAVVLLLICGRAWLHHPTLAPALAVGIGTVAAPFLLMQPTMGAGIAASRTPRPTAARLQSLLTHAIFGVGLYASAWVTSFTIQSWR